MKKCFLNPFAKNNNNTIKIAPWVLRNSLSFFKNGKRAGKQFSNTDLNRYLFPSYYPIFFFCPRSRFLNSALCYPSTTEKLSTVKVLL